MECIFTHRLDRGPDAIARLKAAVAFKGYSASKISDMRYPMDGTGSVAVRFCIILGADLQRDNGPISRAGVEAAFRERRMRFCSGAEALLPVAMDRQLGRGEYPYLAFITGTRDAFIVSDSDAGRSLYLRRHADRGRWSQRYILVGVYE